MVNYRDPSPQSQENRDSSSTGDRSGRFWIGCSDSPVTPFQLDGHPTKLVHVNVGNLAQPSDMSFLASLKMAVDIYELSEIVVCGHYGCRAVEEAASGIRDEILGDWLTPLRALSREHSIDTLAEVNVVEQMANITRASVVRDAWRRGRKITIRGMIFDPNTNRLHDLGDPIHQLDPR